MNHEHGYAFAVAMAGSLQLYYWAFTVGGFRRKAGIAYPIMSATKEEAEKDQNKHLFNCAQRVHYSSLEVFPPFITFLTISATKYPLQAAICGAIFLAGRQAFGYGYLTGDPSKRMRGSFGYIGLIGLLYYSGKVVYDLCF